MIISNIEWRLYDRQAGGCLARDSIEIFGLTDVLYHTGHIFEYIRGRTCRDASPDWRLPPRTPARQSQPQTASTLDDFESLTWIKRIRNISSSQDTFSNTYEAELAAMQPLRRRSSTTAARTAVFWSREACRNARPGDEAQNVLHRQLSKALTQSDGLGHQMLQHCGYDSLARGVIFDKAATLFCSDSLLVLGNTPRPMIMFGDTKQLAPVLRQEGVEERDLGLECQEPGEGNVISPHLDNAADRYWNLAKECGLHLCIIRMHD
ncbi:hypothetical protein FOBRF1_008028 [Fusarium oxysporum]